MDVQLMRKLNKQGFLFAVVHSVIVLNVAFDFLYLL